jgi:hypothetical protein
VASTGRAVKREEEPGGRVSAPAVIRIATIFKALNILRRDGIPALPSTDSYLDREGTAPHPPRYGQKGMFDTGYN